MGRFYQTSKGQYLDFVYKQPRNLLMKTIQVADAQVAKNEAKAADLYGRLKFNALSPDTKRRDEIITGYKGEIDDLSEQIRNSPLDFRRDSPRIRALTDKIKDDMERGEIAAIESNFATRKSYEEKLSEQVKAKAIDANEKAQLLSRYDQDFATKLGTQYKGQQDYQGYKTGYLAENVDLFDVVDKRGKGFKPFLEEKFGWKLSQRGDGKYIVTSKKGDEHVKPERVREAMTQFLSNDKPIAEALGTRMREGIKGYDAKSIKDMYGAAVDYAVGKFAFNKHTESGNVSADSFALAGYKDMLKKKDEVLFRNQDQAAWGNLFNGATTYAESEKNANEFAQGFDNFANATLEDAKTQLLAKNGLQIVDGQIVNIQGVMEGKTLQERQAQYNFGLGNLQNSFETAKKTGDFNLVKQTAKGFGIDINDENVDNFSKNSWTPEVAQTLNNYTNKKESVKKKYIANMKATNPQGYAHLEKTGQLDTYVNNQVGAILDNVKNSTVSTGIFEEQKIGEGVYFDDNKLQQDYLQFLETLEASPMDFLTGKGGTLLVQGGQGQGAEGLEADMNKLIKDGAIRFSRNAIHDTKEVEYTDAYGDTKTKQVKVIREFIDGKEIVFEAGEVMHSYDEVGGMQSGFKYKQRFKVTNPADPDGKPLEVSMMQPESNIPLPDKYQQLKDPEITANRKSANTLIRAEKSNQNLVQQGHINPEDATVEVEGVKGLFINYDAKGNPSHTYNGQKVTRDVAGNIVKLTLMNQELGK